MTRHMLSTLSPAAQQAVRDEIVARLWVAEYALQEFYRGQGTDEGQYRERHEAGAIEADLRRAKVLEAVLAGLSFTYDEARTMTPTSTRAPQNAMGAPLVSGAYQVRIRGSMRETTTTTGFRKAGMRWDKDAFAIELPNAPDAARWIREHADLMKDRERELVLPDGRRVDPVGWGG